MTIKVISNEKRSIEEHNMAEALKFTQRNGYPGYTKKQCQLMVEKLGLLMTPPYMVIAASDYSHVLFDYRKYRPSGVKTFSSILDATKHTLEHFNVERLDLIFVSSESSLFVANSNVVLKAAGELDERVPDFIEPWHKEVV